MYTEDSTGQRVSQEQIDTAIARGRLVLDGESPSRGSMVFGFDTYEQHHVIYVNDNPNGYPEQCQCGPELPPHSAQDHDTWLAIEDKLR